MSNTKTCNGHKNWAYWHVSLWINNDEGLYNFARELVRKLGRREAAKVFVAEVGAAKTPDGVAYTQSNVFAAMEEMEACDRSIALCAEERRRPAELEALIRRKFPVAEGFSTKRFASPTGEYRPPKKGEWYLSGAEIEAWQAPNDLESSYYIARLL